MSPDLRRQVEAIEAAIGDPQTGLPEEVFLFVSRITPLINVDLLIQDDRARTLLTWRDDNYFGQGWHVPGGVIRFKETLAERIRACARAELGADVSADSTPLFVMEGFGTGQTRGHAVSLLFRCRLVSPLDEGRGARSDRPLRGQWRWFERVPPDFISSQAPYAQFL